MYLGLHGLSPALQRTYGERIDSTVVKLMDVTGNLMKTKRTCQSYVSLCGSRRRMPPSLPRSSSASDSASEMTYGETPPCDAS